MVLAPRERPPTPIQLEYIESLGFELDTRYIKTQKEASDIISELLENSGHTCESKIMLEKFKYNKTVYKIVREMVQKTMAEKMAEKWLKASEIRVIAKKIVEEYPDAYVDLNGLVGVCMGWQEKNSKLNPISSCTAVEISKKRNDDFFRILSELNIAPPVCPKCGKTTLLVQNKITREPFWGCSIYPRCGGGLPIDKAIYGSLQP